MRSTAIQKGKTHVLTRDPRRDMHRPQITISSAICTAVRVSLVRTTKGLGTTAYCTELYNITITLNTIQYHCHYPQKVQSAFMVFLLSVFSPFCLISISLMNRAICGFCFSRGKSLSLGRCFGSRVLELSSSVLDRPRRAGIRRLTGRGEKQSSAN